MAKYRFQAIILEKPDGSGYEAHVPALPERDASGTTIDETRRNIRDALRTCIEEFEREGEPILQVRENIRVETISVDLSSQPECQRS